MSRPPVERGADARDDGALLEAIGDGDREAFRVLYERHAPWMLLRLRRRCADPNVVEETVQDVFVAVWRRPGAYRGTGDVAAWMWGIAIRRLVDRMRWGARRAIAPARLGRSQPVLSAEEQVLLGVEHGDLAGALNRLSPELRAVLEATVLDGLTTREAARLLGIPQGTVKTRLMRAREQLREELA